MYAVVSVPVEPYARKIVFTVFQIYIIWHPYGVMGLQLLIYNTEQA
jgi:hypothetical protein